MLFFAWCVAVVAFFAYTAIGVERKITWYLAVDQYGYLTFAHDLLHGHVFHHSTAIDALAPNLPTQVDVLSQTYVYDHGRMYCRYAPGFAAVLAAWLGIFGDDGAAYLNPTVYLALLAVVLAFQARIFRSRWRALAGVTLIGLVPTKVDWWSLTLVRDLPTHLSAFIGLYLLLPVGGRPLAPRRTLAAGLALGWAESIRPDAILYLVPAVCIVGARWWRERPSLQPLLRVAAAGALGVAIGVAPFLAYNWAARGNPFRPTQGMEIGGVAAATPTPPPAEQTVLARIGYPSGAWHGGVTGAVQGGGLRLANLPTTLPGNVKFFRETYTDVLIGLALWGAVIAFLRHRMLFLTAVPYSIVALLFFSCWPRPDDSRYLAGVHCFVPMLIVEGVFGTLDVVRGLWRAGYESPARALATVFGLAMLAAALATPVMAPFRNTALPTLALMLPGIAGIAALAVALWPALRITRWAAPALALALVVVVCTRADAARSRARFQRPEMLRARAALGRVVEPGSVVITVEDVGRPGENIDYYSGVAQAFYMTDLIRWNLQIGDATKLLAQSGLKPYLLIPVDQPGHDFMIARLSQLVRIQLVKDIPPADAMDYFVAAAFYPRGVHMQLYRMNPYVMPRPAAKTAP